MKNQSLITFFMTCLFVNVPHYVMRIQKLFMKLMQCDYIILNIVMACKHDIMSQQDKCQKGVYILFPQKTVFSYERILEQFVLQLVIMNAYSCPST
jgi:hypothetical protein